MNNSQKIAIAEIAKRLDNYEKMHQLVKDLASWDATTDSWYDVFKGFQNTAKKVLKEVDGG